MGSYVVVAIPMDDDPVWKVSSEKIPHITLLYLDDSLENEEQVVEFLQHVADTTLCNFGLSVERRGTLGPKDADVLFFNEPGIRQLENARANLLKNKDVFVAYNATEQHASWVPHLTLGYPNHPAKPNPKDYPMSWVRFDRIAFWNEDYEGPEFRLSVEDEYAPVAMSSMSTFSSPEAALAHFGVKGMHWGRRKAELAAAPRASGYSQSAQNLDKTRFGQRGSDRINEHVSKGLSVERARLKERRHRRNKKLLIAGGVYATLMLATHGPSIAQSIANGYVGKKNAAAGAAAAAKLLADTRGIGNHKIVDLGFNAATGVWG